MPYTTRALYQVGNSEIYLLLPDLYQNIENDVGLKKTQDARGKTPFPLGAALAAGKVRKFKVRVEVTENDVRTRTLVCANDSADSLGGVIGKTLPNNGTVNGGKIKSFSLPRRRIWP